MLIMLTNMLKTPTKRFPLNALRPHDVSLNVLSIDIYLFIRIVCLLLFAFNDFTFVGYDGPVVD